MKKLVIVMVTILTSTFISCKKSDTAKRPTGFAGTWTLYQVYGNDYWGGAAYWKRADPGTKIEFTLDKYYRKYPTESIYTLIGTYKKVSNNEIEITPVNPPNASYPTYILNYNFETGGFMTWGIFGTEGVIKEKFKVDN